MKKALGTAWLIPLFLGVGNTVAIAKLPPPQIAYSSDGTLIAVTRSRPLPSGVQLYDANNRTEVVFFPTDLWWDHTLTFSPDNRFLALVSPAMDLTTTRRVTIWDLATRQELIIPYTISSVETVGFSADGKLLALAGDRRISLWDIAAQREIAAIDVKDSDTVSSLAFSPDSKLLAWGGSGGAHLWNVEAQREVAMVGKKAPFWASSVVFSPDGKTLSTATSSLEGVAIRVWDLSTMQESATLIGYTGPVASTVDGRIMVATAEDFVVAVWDVLSGAEIASRSYDDQVSSVAVRGDGRKVAVVDYNSTISIWDLAQAPSTAISESSWGQVKRLPRP